MAQARMEFVFCGWAQGEYQDANKVPQPYVRAVLYDPTEVKPVVIKPFIPREGGERRAICAAMRKWAENLKLGEKCSAIYQIGTDVTRARFEGQGDTASLRFQWVSA